MVSRTKAELGLLKMAIDDYQTKLGHYPPDNPGLPSTNQLYFELMGTRPVTNLNAAAYQTLDGSALVRQSDFTTYLEGGVQRIVNCSAKGGDEDARVAERFLKSDLKPQQVAYPTDNPNMKFLVCSIAAPYQTRGFTPASPNFFRYNFSNPTNNPNSYDLWVDIVIAGRTNRISNWSTEPIIVATPY